MKFILPFLLFFFLKESNSAPPIVQGIKVNITEVPYQVALINIDPKLQFCGGAFLKINFVITAGHCVYQGENEEPKKNFVISGGSNTYGDGTATELKVLNVLLHPHYDHIISDYDVALVKIENTPEFPKLQNLVKLPVPYEEFKDGQLMLVSGWGGTQSIFEPKTELRAIRIPIYNQQKCEQAYDVIKTDITNRMICVGYKKGIYGPCKGDSGGPLVDFNSRELVGIVSFGGMPCGNRMFPGVFTRVTSVHDWIVLIVEQFSDVANNTSTLSAALDKKSFK
ncbi:hypothetical protein PVAND_013561 [Polypedilum vanderplanki]|uniref:trypsin n=1 Tax=Polypedilum vanderplanki TaxID=319348 RepID=A0A9J6CRS6_POLVA|nr:hypothetical protein PVAND_013561 [Polypedilum vanderplanki]